MNDDLRVYTTAAVHADTVMNLWRSTDGEVESITIGKDQQVTLDFYDADGLERLRDLLDEGARRHRETDRD